MNARPNLAALLAVAGGMTLLAAPAPASANPCGGSSATSYSNQYSSSAPQIDSAELAKQSEERAAARAVRKAAKEAAKAARATAQASAADATTTKPTANPGS